LSEHSDALAAYRLARARQTLEEARLMADAGHANGCMNRLYYACFYAVSAPLISHGLSSSKHSGVRSLFAQHFVKPGVVAEELGDTYNELFDKRQGSDYEDFFCVDSAQLPELLIRASDFVSAISALLNKPA
jgi:uncharacterized protein (UPF0332 family)